MHRATANPFTDGEAAAPIEGSLTPRIRLVELTQDEAVVDVEMVSERGMVVHTLHRVALRVGHALPIKSVRVEISIKEQP